MSEIRPKEINLKIEVRSKFNYGGRGTAIDIRDSELVIIERLTTEREFYLHPGLYEVSAFLGDGKRASQIVEVFDSQLTEISFEPDLDYQPSPPDDSSKFKSIEELKQVDSSVAILEAEAGFTIFPAESYWIVQHKDVMQKVSAITFKKNGLHIQASLPISQGHHYSVTCHVKQVVDSQFGYMQINISQSRSIAFGLESMLKNGQIMKAAEVASNALEALIEKYTDPTGASLAALILYKTRQLDEWNKKYLVRLARNNGWLPDAKIILALYLARTDHSEYALKLACEASKQRILLTESFSLLLDLLRYWPDATHNEQRNEALARLARIAPLVVWESMYLTTTIVPGV
ncbi:hypothetical protein [Pseudomonas aeruginosa]|uniref:hypothetical protein n=1 Tax=Pseudomonas aeruginosa TaxID=287 RepID=UPI0039681C10|nr:hypothetical protein [Pseudomonas aeruginosa]